MARNTRARQSKQQKDQEKHYAYIKKYREDPAYVKEENKRRVLNRIKKGGIPNVDSMRIYDITLEDINRLREQYEFEPIVLNVPMFLQSRLYRGRDGVAEADFVQEVSEVQDEYRPQQEDEEVDQPGPDPSVVDEPDDDVPLAQLQLKKNKQFTGKSDAMSISIWMRSNPRQATQKREGEVSFNTLKNQYGAPNSEGTGDFYRFLKYLGEEYVKDVSLILRKKTLGGEDTIEFLREKINNPERENLNPRAGKKFKSLETTNSEYTTILIALRNYPLYAKDIKIDERLKDAYSALDRLFTETDAKIQSIKLQNPKKQKPVKSWLEVVKAIKTKYKDPLSKENLYISCYDEHPARDDFAELFVDATENPLPINRAQVKAISKNTIFLPNKTTRKTMKKAIMVLVNYKTKAIYGTRELEFSEALTKRLIKYHEKEGGIYLFGKPKMSIWVGKMLDSVNIKDRDKTNITYLRRSYVSSALAKITTEKERQQLSFALRHSPSSSIKYIRKLEEDPDAKLENIAEEVLKKATKNKFNLQAKE
jgi:hypothetical protein